jgi:hypothetical protein
MQQYYAKANHITRQMSNRWIVLLLLFSMSGASCGYSQAGTEQAPAPPPAVSTSVPATGSTPNSSPFPRTPEVTEMPSAPPVEKFVELAKKDLASRLRTDVEKIKLVKTADMLWLNAALGCPRPGKVYPEGRVPGFQIWLELAGTEYIYNTDFNGTLILCPELNPSIPNSNNDPTPGVPIR